MDGEHGGELIAVRHGCSIWNASGRFTGAADVGLSAEGQQEATEAAQVLRQTGVQPSLIVTSALTRARDTAEIIRQVCGWSSRVVVTRGLDERDHGVLEGLTHAQAEQEFGAEHVRVWRRTGAGRPPQGESFQDVLARVENVWATLIRPELDADRTVIVVGHGTSLRCLLVAAGESVERASRFEVPRAQPAFVRRPSGAWEPVVAIPSR